MSEEAHLSPPADVACVTAQGSRESQQDAVLAEANPDGSWVIAVADGTGCGPRCDEVAAAAIGALPRRINSDSQMAQAFADANTMARSLQPGSASQAEGPHDDLSPSWTRNDLCLAVAAWTPESGLIAGWIGDSIPFLLPASGRRCWAGLPMDMSGTLIVGDFALMPGGGPAPSLMESLRLMSEGIGRAELDQIAADEGLVVAVCSDGAYNGWMADPDGGKFGEYDMYPYLWENADPEQAEQLAADGYTASGLWQAGDPDEPPPAMMLLGPHALASATTAANAILNMAAAAGLSDNTSVAAARIPPSPS